jgi:hypothetical protein
VKPWVRWAVLGAAAVVVVVLFVTLRPGGTSEGTTPTPSVTPSPSGSVSPTGSPSPSPSPQPEAVEIQVEVEDGQVRGPDRPTVRQGELVLLIVEADVSDEVHLHGYDLSADVAPGQPARIRFRADVAGVFEVELEDAGRLLLELEITP